MEEFLRPQELLIILVIILVLFGGAKLPELARNLGKAQRELRNGFREGAEEAEAGSATQDKAAAGKTAEADKS